MNDTMGAETSTTAYNRPHKPAIHYSGKGYDEYRADLIKRLQDKGFLLKEGEQDFLNAFIDLTAYLGDVLMTYQNAYAQEIYLETAQLRESLFGLASMVDYRIHPGSAATGTLVVMAKPGKAGLLPKGFQASGKEENAKDLVFFETDTDLQVDAAFNDFPLAEQKRWSSVTINADDKNVTIQLQEKSAVKPGQYIYFRKTGSPKAHYFGQIQSSGVDDKTGNQTLSFKKKKSSRSGKFSAADGTWCLIHNDSRGVYKLISKTQSKTSQICLDNKYEDIIAGSPVVLRRDSDAAYGIVTDISFETIYVKTGTSTRTSGRDIVTTETAQTATCSEPSPDPNRRDGEEWLSCYKIFLDQDKKMSQTYDVYEKTYKEPREVCKLSIQWLADVVPPSDYGKDTGNKTKPAEKSSNDFVFAGIQTPLSTITQKPNTTSLEGKTKLIVQGDFTGMEKYRTVILHEEINGNKKTEEADIFSCDYHSKTNISTIHLRKPIVDKFTRFGVKVWGNTVAATQGKTVNETVLGSGRGEEAYQTFEFPQSPLTFEMHANEGLEGALQVSVSGQPWSQQDDFMNSTAEDRHYVIETDYAQKSRLTFGDGVNGSRLPTGRDNVVAKFRIGQGSGGNLSSGLLTNAASKPAFFDEVFNVYNMEGGSDPDTEEQLRTKIPAEHITFDRAVSLRDYADLALTYPGISKAKAGWRWMHNRQYVVLAVAGRTRPEISPDTLKDLRAYLNARRDPNQPLIVQQADIVPVTLTLSVLSSAGYDPDRVQDAVTQALGTETLPDGSLPFFHFDRLAIGMSIHKKDLYKIVENTPGVELINHLDVKRTDESVDTGYLKPSFCPDDVWIYNWELPTLDMPTQDIRVTPIAANTVCEKAGG